MTRDEVIADAFRALSKDLKPCPAAKRCPHPIRGDSINNAPPEGWLEMPLRNVGDLWNAHTRPAPVWDYLHSIGAKWILTEENVWFVDERDANAFMEWEWFQFRDYVVIEETRQSEGHYIERKLIYRGNSLEDAVTAKMSGDYRRLIKAEGDEGNSR